MWKVLLKTGEVIAHPDFNDAYYDEDMFVFKRVTKYSDKKIITTGFWFWKKPKEIEVWKRKTEVLLVIPMSNVQYVYDGGEYRGNEFIEKKGENENDKDKDKNKEGS